MEKVRSMELAKVDLSSSALEPITKIPNNAPLARHEFLPLISSDVDVLEIGPAHAPCFRGPNVRYFDVLDSAGLRQRAKELDVRQYGHDPADTPKLIHYVSSIADLGIIDRQFDIVFSSHAIEHQVDLVAHLQAVSRLLRPNGAYLVICPDRRYGFDAHRSESTIGQAIEAHEIGRKRHSLATLIDDQVYRTHNDCVRHWRGDKERLRRFSGKQVLDAMDLWRRSERTGEYIDRHAWLFTPTSFELIMKCLYEAGFVDLKPRRVFDTPVDTGEFISAFVKV